jgi:hypothetical protein
VPPGDDPEALARQIVGHLHARVDPPLAGAASPSWSCWVTASITAALATSVGLGPVALAATRRTDDRAPTADFHAAVVVGEGADAWLCEPYFGVALPLPEEPGRGAAVDLGSVAADVVRTTDHGWDLNVRLATWSAGLSYRLLAPALDRDDVRALCAVSVSHTGVPNRPYARLHADGGALDVHEDAQGAGVVRHPVRPPSAPAGAPATLETTTYPDWVGAADDFAARTGVRIV